MTVDTSAYSVLAQRYAASRLDSLLEKKHQALADEIDQLLALLNDSEDLQTLIANPLFSKDTKKTVFDELMTKANLSKELGHFIFTIIEHNRLYMLAEILGAVLQELGERRGEVDAKVESAYPLDQKQVQNIADEIEHLIGSKVNLLISVNPGLIGGVVLTIGSKRFDGSVKRRLELLEQRLIKGITKNN